MIEPDDAQERAQLESLLGAMRQAGPPPRYRGSDLGSQEIPEDMVAGFRLMEELGQGGQGVVFRALQESTGREVALKLLREGPLADMRSRHRFEREIEIVASLEHPNIISLYGAGRTEDGHGWVAMELVEGHHLRGHLAHRELGWRARLGLLEQVAEALVEAHQHGVIHLDLKPGNVLVREDGQVRVVDFGLARSLLMESGTLSLETMGGTPGFMAPEQVRSGLAGCDIRTDIHALGALLFFLMTGTTPYVEGESLFSSLEAVAAGKLRELDAAIHESILAPRSPRLQRDLVAVCRMAMSLDPAHRYRRVDDFLADLRALQTGGVVIARQGDRRYRWSVTMRRLRPVFFLLLIATAITWGSVKIALRQRQLTDLAEGRFQQAQEIAESFLLEIDPLIASLPGSGPARERIISRGTDYLEQLLASAPDDAGLRLKAARGFRAIARVQADIYTMSSGRLEESLHTLDRLLEAVPRDDLRMQLDPVDQEFAFVLEVQAYLLGARIARDLSMAGRRDQDLQTALLAFSDGSPFQTIDALRAYSMVLEEWGRRLAEKGELADSRDYLQRSRVVLESMLKQFAGNEEAMRNLERDLAVLVFHEAALARVSGDLEAAEDLLRTFHADAEARLRLRPSLVAKRDVATALERLSGYAKQRGDFAAALTRIEQARDLHLEMVTAQPDHPTSWAGQISLTNRIAELHLAAVNLEAAGEWINRFEAESVDFVARFPNFARAQRMLGVAHYKQHELAVAQSRPADALRSLQRSIAVFLALEKSGKLSEADVGIPAALMEEAKALEILLRSR